MRQLTVRQESWPLREAFRISRGATTEIQVVVAEIREGRWLGRGECRPYARYGETPGGVAAAIEALAEDVADGLEREALQARLPPGAARNALDCALWDLAAKRAGVPVWQLAGLAPPQPLTTAYTLSVAAPDTLAEAAHGHAWRPLLKLKLAGPGDLERVEAVRAAAPKSRLIVDANEAWSVADYQWFAPKLARLGVELLEQPFPAGSDTCLEDMDRPVPVCADESCHDRASLARLAGRYDVVNLKLDKAGGLTEGLRMKAEAEARGFRVMVGCMMSTSLALAPAVLLAQGADYVDLDAALLLAQDRREGLHYEGSLVFPGSAAVWG